jgi:hypothetical protein
VLARPTRRTAPFLRDAGDIEEAVEEALRGLDPPDRAARSGITGQVDDAGDLVTGADGTQRAKVGDVGLLGDDGQVRQMGRYLAGATLDQDARLAEVVQRADSVGADEAGTSGDKDHHVILRLST